MKKQPAMANISLLMHLHSFFSSIFSFSAFEAVLYPAIKKAPFPFKNMTPRITSDPTTAPWMASNTVSPPITAFHCDFTIVSLKIQYKVGYSFRLQLRKSLL